MSTTNNVILAGFLQLCLAATFAVAAPVAESADTVTTTVVDNAWSYGTGGGLLGLVVLILDVIIFGMFILLVRSPFLSTHFANSLQPRSSSPTARPPLSSSGCSSSSSSPSSEPSSTGSSPTATPTTAVQGRTRLFLKRVTIGRRKCVDNMPITFNAGGWHME